MEKIELGFFYLEIFTSIFCFLLSIKLWFRPNPPYLNAFLLYLLLSLLFGIINVIATYKAPNYFSVIHFAGRISIGFHYYLLSYIIIALQLNPKLKRIQIFITAVIGVVIFYKIVLLMYKPSVDYEIFFIANLTLIILGLFYFASFLKSENFKNTYNLPSFWIISGVMLGMGFNIPVFGLMNFLIENIQIRYVVILNIFVAVGFIIMYILFIKAILAAYKNREIADVS